MNTERKQAEVEFKNASRKVNTYNGNDESEFNALWDAFQESSRKLAALEIAHPTAQETKRQNEKLRLANMGIRD